MTKTNLSLYSSPYCPYCQFVLKAIADLDIEVQILNTSDDENRTALINARGRGTVPVLKITNQDGTVSLMPESSDIVAFLNKTYA